MRWMCNLGLQDNGIGSARGEQLRADGAGNNGDCSDRNHLLDVLEHRGVGSIVAFAHEERVCHTRIPLLLLGRYHGTVAQPAPAAHPIAN